jgi:hypothetical protein
MTKLRMASVYIDGKHVDDLADGETKRIET